MLRLSIIFFLFYLTSITSAWACSCGGKPILVSDFLKDVTVVYGTAQKTEWLGHTVPTPVNDDSWWKNSHLRTQTTLIDVEYLSGEHKEELSFYHSPHKASCGINPNMGSRKWFVLSNDPKDNLSYFYCTASRIPIGAILDFKLNGNDPLVPSRGICHAFKRDIKKTEKSPPSSPIDNWNCAFWSNDNQKRLNEIWRKHWNQEIDSRKAIKTNGL